jgi:hypothetical protein
MDEKVELHFIYKEVDVLVAYPGKIPLTRAVGTVEIQNQIYAQNLGLQPFYDVIHSPQVSEP